MKVKKICESAKGIVGKGGQVTLPIRIRKKYGIKEGDMIVLDVIECVIDEEKKKE